MQIRLQLRLKNGGKLRNDLSFSNKYLLQKFLAAVAARSLRTPREIFPNVKDVRRHVSTKRYGSIQLLQ